MLTKTIFITSFHGLVSRVLSSGVLDRLFQDETVRVVLLVPDFKINHFREAFGSYDRIVIEGIPQKKLPWQTYLFHQLSFLLLDTKTMHLIRRSHRGYYRSPVRFLAADALSGGIGRFRWGRALFRSLNHYFSGAPIFSDHFDRYRPDLVFSTDNKHMLDTALLIEAKKRGIPTTAMVRSWDYLTAKGLVRVRPDTMIVHNEIIKDEAVRYADMLPENVTVIGIPHFDPYVNEQRSVRNKFFKRIGASPKTRLLLYAPIGSKFGSTDGEILDMLGRAVTEGRLPKDLSVLVRLPPGDTMEVSGLGNYPFIYFDEPGETFDDRHRKANEMTYEDLLHLADSLFWSDVVVTGPSTMAIDAAAFDTPAIFVNFDGRKTLPYFESVRHYYDFLHLQNVVRTRGVRFAGTGEELLDHLKHYLEDPSSEQAERGRIVTEQCVVLDGKASKRLAELLLGQLSHT